MRAALKPHREIVGHGPPLALLHGWGWHSGVWSALVPQLARRFEVHAIDLPGHGHSQACAPRSFEDAAQAVANVLPDDAVVCGWSLGALFAQWIAAREPSRARALVLAAATPCFVQRGDWRCAMAPSDFEAFSTRVERDPGEALAYFAGLNAWGGERPREVARMLRDQIPARGAPAREPLLAALGWLRDTDLRAIADAIDVPTRVVQGAGDALVPVAAGRWLAQRIPGATAIEIAEAGHAPFASRPLALAEALEALPCAA